MKMRDSLPGRRPKVKPDVKSFGRIARFDNANCLVNRRPNPLFLDICQFVPRRDMASGDNEKMTRVYGIRIPNTVTSSAGKRDSLRRYGAKRTTTIMVHEI